MFETLRYWMNYVFKTKNPLNEWNVILTYYVMDYSNFKNYNYFKSLLNYFKLFFKLFFFYNMFYMSYSIMN
jgi:hypothetical protein